MIHPNRQARRSARCFRARRPAPLEPALTRRGLALRAYGGDLAQLAESIADELELPPDLVEHLLSPGCHRA
jgi:hypothetical protein